jgi:hypothetical protein
MGCGCGKGSSISATEVATEYVFTHPDTGRQTTYRTKYEAEYANLRVGGRGTITAQPKS